MAVDLWLPPSAVLGAAAPDFRTQMEAQAIMVARTHGFAYSGSTPDQRELYFQRYLAAYVDLLSIAANVQEPSLATRYERQGFPWPKGEWPEPLRTVTGSIVDTVRQVLEWPTS
jgi:hypothetical protein